MHLSQVTLTNVCQFTNRTFEFRPGFNLLVGENGVGKSTLLRSIAAVLGPTGARHATPFLTDEDIRLNSGRLKIDAQVSHSQDAQSSHSYQREWGARAHRRHESSPPLLLIYGSNESTPANFVSKHKRRRTARRTEPQHFREQEWLYEEMERSPSAEKDIERFGNSREIRHFVLRVLSFFSPNILDFGWVFEPYRCTVRPRAAGPGDLNPKAKRLIANAILRYLDERKKPLRTGEQRLLTLDSSGHLIGDKVNFRRWDPIPPFDKLLSRFGIGDIPKGDFENVVAEIHLTPRIRIDTRDGPLSLSQMSDGEKRLFSIFVDIARQISISRDGRRIEDFPAIVLIDEIDVHLHPKWQRLIVPKLEDLFPACQFIATTHSPFVVQGVDESQVQHLDHLLVGDFSDRGIEEIAVKVMGIEDHDVSPRYLEMLDAARKYFRLLESAEADKEVGNIAALEEAEREMERLSSRYARNPAYQAFLELNQNLRLGGG